MTAADPGSQRGPFSAVAQQLEPGYHTAIGERTIKIEAARAGVTPQEYLDRLARRILYCYRCSDWHDASAFPADSRRHSGRAGSCTSAVRAATTTSEPAAPTQPPAPAATWVVRRPDQASATGQTWQYWSRPRHPGRLGPDPEGTWSPDLDQDATRFQTANDAHAALITAHGSIGAVPPGCRLVRLA